MIACFVDSRQSWVDEVINNKNNELELELENSLLDKIAHSKLQ